MKRFLHKTIALVILAFMLLSAVACDIAINFDDLINAGDIQGSLDIDADIDANVGSTDKETEKSTKKVINKATARPTEKPTEKLEGSEELVPFDEVDFDGQQINILVRNDVKVSREWESKTGSDDELDLAVAARNRAVEKELDVDVYIKLIGGSSYDSWKSAATEYICRDVDNRLQEYDISASFGFNSMKPYLRDYFADLRDTDLFPYFDFTAPCWQQDIVNNGTVNGKLYFCAGDMNLSMFDTAIVMWHNMTLYEEVRQESDPANIQDLVLEGDWTYKQLYRWASYYDAKSLSGCDDVYGVYIQGVPYPEQPNDAMPYIWQISSVTENSDGTHSFNIANNADLGIAISRFKALYNSTGNAWNWALRGGCTHASVGHLAMKCFTEGHILFCGDILHWNDSGNAALRAMADNYTIIPWPKYTEDQEDYATSSQDYLTTMSALNHFEYGDSMKGRAISAYLQYANEYSSEHVKSYYFEDIIAQKWFGNPQEKHVQKSITIFNNIMDSLEFRFETMYGPMTEGLILDIWRKAPYSDTSIVSEYQNNKTEYDKALDKVDRWFGLIE